MQYTKKHIAAVEARLKDYDRVLKSKDFIRLPFCQICNTVGMTGDRYTRSRDCKSCLFSGGKDEYMACASSDGNCGALCTDKDMQRKQYKYLLKQLDRCGYEFK